MAVKPGWPTRPSARREMARRLLGEARELETSLGNVRVTGPEGLIACKIQGFVNDRRRTQDIEDIRALLIANRDTLNLAEVREYFRLFDQETLLDELLQEAR